MTSLVYHQQCITAYMYIVSRHPEYVFQNKCKVEYKLQRTPGDRPILIMTDSPIHTTELLAS